MFCYQCTQTARGTGCVEHGTCGKDADVAALQDLLLYAAEGIAAYAHRARGLGVRDAAVDGFVLKALFTTVTNVNFDPARMEALLSEAVHLRDRIASLWREACVAAGVDPVAPGGPAQWQPADDRTGLIGQAEAAGIASRTAAQGPDVTGLQELLTYGLKGVAAYAHHARILGREDEAVYAFLHEALDRLAEPVTDVDELLDLNLRCGAVSVRVLELLDGANTGSYGAPEPTPVRMGHVPGKAILVSGHDLKDLKALLEETAGTGINIYTHGEMLPAHGYPELKKYPHLVGHYGGAWQRQRQEFDAFPGAILMTTNCIQNPAPTYRDRLFTSGLVAWPDVRHIDGGDFRPVIDAALQAPGFTDASPERFHTVGFGHDAVVDVAEPIIDAVKQGALRHFVLIGGCDGVEASRGYFTELAEGVPEDCAVLTLGCGKFRIIDHDYGSIGGLPRLLDMGQCNDAYSAVRVAQALAGAFGVGIHDLPLSLVLSWYEQKAVCVLLALLALGVKNIRLGPKLPAFLTPALLDVLVDRFNIMPIGTAAEDLRAMGLTRAA
jgi:hydroxylamine reductase